jgi:hypothetical protein
LGAEPTSMPHANYVRRQPKKVTAAAHAMPPTGLTLVNSARMIIPPLW